MGLCAQKRVPNKGIGISFSTLAVGVPSQVAVAPLLQLHYTYLPSKNIILRGAVGSFVGIDDDEPFFRAPVWLTVGCLYLHKYNKKKKIHWVYGGSFDIAFDEFAYAIDGKRLTAPFYYYKRVLAGISPQSGVFIKTSKKSFLTITLTAGVADTFVKLTDAPDGRILLKRPIVPLMLKAEYSFLFKRKRR